MNDANSRGPVDASSIGSSLSLEKRLVAISHTHPFKSATLITLEHQQIVADYSAGADLVADYLQYKYSTPKPLGFLLWYVDVVKAHQSEHAKTARPQNGCYPDPHRFP